MHLSRRPKQKTLGLCRLVHLLAVQQQIKRFMIFYVDYLNLIPVLILLLLHLKQRKDGYSAHGLVDLLEQKHLQHVIISATACLLPLRIKDK